MSLASLIERVEPKVIGWRRTIHENPELGFQEHETAALVAGHLESLGIAVMRGVAETGVVGVLRGDIDAPAVALRADMDALPVEEATGRAWASKWRAVWQGEEVPVMHACGHDAHVAILMGVAEVLAGSADRLRRPVKLIFQPAEEGVPGRKNGAELMIEEGVLESPEVGEIYGLHVTQSLPSGVIGMRPGGMMASVDELVIEVIGRQTHGAYPWLGIDPVVIASQIILALQTIPSRQVDLTASAAIVTIGKIEAGVRSNIIPERLRMEGTIRALDESVRGEVHERIRRAAESIASAAGGRVEVEIESGYPVTANDPEATERCRELLARTLGRDRVIEIPPVFGAEDFSFFLQQRPGTYFFLGVRPPGKASTEAVANHSEYFDVDEAALGTGVLALATMAIGEATA
jgi:amidohydrolase